MQITFNIVFVIAFTVVAWLLFAQRRQTRSALAKLNSQQSSEPGINTVPELEGKVQKLESYARLSGYLWHEIFSVLALERRVMSLVQAQGARGPYVAAVLEARSQALNLVENMSGTLGDIGADIRSVNAAKENLHMALQALSQDLQLAAITRQQIAETRQDLVRWKPLLEKVEALIGAEAKLGNAETLLKEQKLEEAIRLVSPVVQAVSRATAN